MNTVKTIITIFVLSLLTACDAWILGNYGSEGDPCFTNDTCKGDLQCCADGTCHASCDGTGNSDGDNSTDDDDDDNDNASDGDSDGDDDDDDDDDDTVSDGDSDGDDDDNDNASDGDSDGDDDDDDDDDDTVSDGDSDGDDDDDDTVSDGDSDDDEPDGDEDGDTDGDEEEPVDCDPFTESCSCGSHADCDLYGTASWLSCNGGGSCEPACMNGHYNQYCASSYEFATVRYNDGDGCAPVPCQEDADCAGLAACDMPGSVMSSTFFHCDDTNYQCRRVTSSCFEEASCTCYNDYDCPSWLYCEQPSATCAGVCHATMTNEQCDTDATGHLFATLHYGCAEVPCRTNAHCAGLADCDDPQGESNPVIACHENHCERSLSCNPENPGCSCTDGFCVCAEGYTGDLCDACADGFIGYPDCEPDYCLGNTCSDHGTCNQEDGSCNCDNEYMTEDCSACQEGYWNYPNCLPESTPGFVPIPAGSFWMGSPDGVTCPEGYPGDCTAELGRESDETLHYVQLTYDFEMQQHETTQGEWQTAFGNNPSYFGPSGNGTNCGDNCPVERVNWYEALAYANWLSEQQDLEPCYVLTNCTGTLGGGCSDTGSCSSETYSCTVSLNSVSKPQDCEGYRLPTEAEWEYAARAGSYTAFHPSDGNDGTITQMGSSPVDSNLDQIAWYAGNNGSIGTQEYGTKPVGSKEENTWGLYDMSGNVLDWVWDWYASSYPAGTVESPLVDPTGNVTGPNRVFRSGAWNGEAQRCRSAARRNYLPNYRDDMIGFRLVRSLNPPTPGFTHIPAGSFWMGSPDGCPGPEGYPGDCTAEAGRQTNETLHYVQLTYDFEMQAHEVTQGEWQTAFEGNPSYFGPNGNGDNCGDNCPVERVNWFEALKYANWLSQQHGLEPCYMLTNCTGTLGGGCAASATYCSSGTYACTVSLNGVSKPQECEGYRLPTEAEWEYAARAGSHTAFYPSDGNDGTITQPTGNDPNLNLIGWYSQNAGSKTRPIGGKAANSWGLYDMNGNVEEWTWDWYGTYPSGTPASPLVDPTGAASGSERILRGGGWYYSAKLCRSANRPDNPPGDRDRGLGLRLVRTIFGHCSPNPCPTQSTCNPTDGTCDCENEYMTEDCSACEEGYTGFPDCTLAFSEGYCETSQCWPVPSTGQTACYSNYTSIACPGEAGSETCGTTDFCGQDAQYPDNERTFTCYNAAGVETPCESLNTASEDEVVTDSLTGLMWQRTWTTNKTWQQAVDYCDTLTYGGHSDWRLPNPHELRSLVDYGRYNPNINTTAFPGMPSNLFWSSSTHIDDDSLAWSVKFSFGYVNGSNKTDDYNARCVREGPVESGLGSFDPFVISGEAGEEVVTDLVTGLVWKKTYTTGKTWRQALVYCESLSYAGHSDWRLPNVSELASLVSYNRTNPASDFPDMPSNWFWSSSTSVNDNDCAGYVYFDDGYMNFSYKVLTGYYYARCVRGGP